MSQAQRLQVLRDYLYQRPSSRLWEAICAHIDAWPIHEGRCIGVDYAEAHMHHWPDDYRRAPQSWLQEIRQGIDPIAWKIVRSVEPTDYLQQDYVRLFRSHYLERITHLAIRNAHIKSPVFWGLFSSPHIGAIKSLSLVGGAMPSWDALRCLATKPIGQQLTELQLTNTYATMGRYEQNQLPEDAFPNVTKLNLTSSNIGHALLVQMKKNPHWAQMTHLNLSGNRLHTSALREYEGATFWHQLTHLDYSGNLPHRGGCNTLFRIMEGAPLQELQLDRCELHEECFKGLFDYTHGNRLRRLSLRGNRIDDRCLSILSRLPALRELEVLELDRNRYSGKGMSKLVTSRYLSHECKKPFLKRMEDHQLRDLLAQCKMRTTRRMNRFQMMDLLLQTTEGDAPQNTQ